MTESLDKKIEQTQYKSVHDLPSNVLDLEDVKASIKSAQKELKGAIMKYPHKSQYLYDELAEIDKIFKDKFGSLANG